MSEPTAASVETQPTCLATATEAATNPRPASVTQTSAEPVPERSGNPGRLPLVSEHEGGWTARGEYAHPDCTCADTRDLERIEAQLREAITRGLYPGFDPKMTPEGVRMVEEFGHIDVDRVLDSVKNDPGLDIRLRPEPAESEPETAATPATDGPLDPYAFVPAATGSRD